MVFRLTDQRVSLSLSLCACVCVCRICAYTENLNRLKYLRYLNVSLNNITVIENLDGCESLEKLDLTGNFLDVTSIEPSMENLSNCERLRSLFLIGNPCLEEFE